MYWILLSIELVFVVTYLIFPPVSYPLSFPVLLLQLCSFPLSLYVLCRGAREGHRWRSTCVAWTCSLTLVHLPVKRRLRTQQETWEGGVWRWLCCCNSLWSPWCSIRQYRNVIWLSWWSSCWWLCWGWKVMFTAPFLLLLYEKGNLPWWCGWKTYMDKMPYHRFWQQVGKQIVASPCKMEPIPSK